MDNNIKQEKRNAKGGGSVRQRSDGRWEARCTINGKRRSFYADKQQDALKAMRAAQKENDEGQYLEPSKITVGQWLEIWLEEYHRQTIKETSYKMYHDALTRHIIPELGKVKLSMLNTMQVQKFCNLLTTQKNLSSTHTRKIIALLKCSLNQAIKLRYISVNPVCGCTLPKKEQKEFLPLTEDEIALFLKEIDNYPNYSDLFRVTLFTGMRMGEITGLSWDNVDFSKSTITIKQQLVQKFGMPYYISTTKNGKTRTITPAPFVMDILKEVRQKQLSDQLNAGKAWKNQFNLVFTNKLGRFLMQNTITHLCKDIVKKIGRPDFRFHDLRHTYAVMALQEGDNPKIVQENLGHSTATFTLNVYAHVSEKMKQDSANRFQAYYEKIKAKN